MFRPELVSPPPTPEPFDAEHRVTVERAQQLYGDVPGCGRPRFRGTVPVDLIAEVEAVGTVRRQPEPPGAPQPRDARRRVPWTSRP